LVGAPTGARNGWDVLDVDPAGVGWYDQNFDALPLTRAHETPRGVHLLFRHCPGLRGSVGKIAPGVDVRAEGNFVVWWPREGYPVEDAPIAEWPDWLLAEARAKGRRNGVLTNSKSIEGELPNVRVVPGAQAALEQMDPCVFREHDRWFALMMGCKAVGIARDVFVEWSVGDEAYADHAELIRTRWNSVTVLHAGAFYAELKLAGIRLQASNTFELGEHPVRAPVTPTTRNPSARFKVLIRELERDGREDLLFWTACRFAEMVAEGWPKVGVAQRMLEQACKDNGLWRALGADGCRQTITNAFRNVEEELLGEAE
jgi:hypothetical protein